MNYNFASIKGLGPGSLPFLRKIHKARRAENFSGNEQNSSSVKVFEQNFEQNKRFLRAVPAGKISHFTSRIYPSLEYSRLSALRPLAASSGSAETAVFSGEINPKYFMLFYSSLFTTVTNLGFKYILFYCFYCSERVTLVPWNNLKYLWSILAIESFHAVCSWPNALRIS